MILKQLLESGSTFECELLADGLEEPAYSFIWEPKIRVTEKGNYRWNDTLYAPAHLKGGNIILEGVEDPDAYYDFVATVAGAGPADEYEDLIETIDLGGDKSVSCDGCGGWGYYTDDDGQWKCIACNGTGEVAR